MASFGGIELPERHDSTKAEGAVHDVAVLVAPDVFAKIKGSAGVDGAGKDAGKVGQVLVQLLEAFGIIPIYFRLP